jgi:hypothetical protein
LPDADAWTAALKAVGLVPTATAPGKDQARFEIAQPVSVVAAKLKKKSLLAARVEAIPKHYTTTWGALRASPPAGFVIGGTTIPDAQLDLAGLYVGRAVPSGAYALITEERPTDYWYVLPITVAVAAIGLIFAWALVRAVRRDLLPARAANPYTHTWRGDRQEPTPTAIRSRRSTANR